MAFDRQSPPAPAAPAGVVEDQRLSAVIQDLKQASAEYHAEYFGHFLNEQQVDAARSEIAKMGTAAAHLYDHWQRSRDALPTSAEIGAVVDPLTFRSRLSQFMPRRLAEDDGTPDKGSRFTRLANLNERVRQAAEEITEALPMLRDQVLYARHFEQNCMRLYRGEDRESERLQDAEDLRLTVEQTLQTSRVTSTPQVSDSIADAIRPNAPCDSGADSHGNRPGGDGCGVIAAFIQ